VELVNYGYTPVTRTVTITGGQDTNLEITLQAVASTVSPTFGAMTIEGANRKAVLLNGKTPDFFVGHGDEFNHAWWWKQELVVPPGTYQMTILGPENEETNAMTPTIRFFSLLSSALRNAGDASRIC
jgi:hypothetical protein